MGTKIKFTCQNVIIENLKYDKRFTDIAVSLLNNMQLLYLPMNSNECAMMSRAHFNGI